MESARIDRDCESSCETCLLGFISATYLSVIMLLSIHIQVSLINRFRSLISFLNPYK